MQNPTQKFRQGYIIFEKSGILSRKWAPTTVLAIIFWDILMFDKIFVSPQMKRIVIISNKDGIYELPHELLNDLRLTTLEN